MPRLRITKSKVNNLPYANSGQVLYRDTDLRPFGVCVGKRTKTYFVQRNLAGKTLRISLGRHGEVTPHEARKKAFEVLHRISDGAHPTANQREERANAITLREAYREYLETRKELSRRMRHDYWDTLNRYVPDRLDLPIASITGRLCLERHGLIGSQNGKSVANTTMRIIRAIYNCMAATYETLPPNPVSRLTQTRAWYREARRRTLIRLHDLSRWYIAVMDLENEAMRDYLRLLLFTGLRRSEGLGLRWADVDFGNRILTIPNTKNHEPLTLPLSDFLYELLGRRRESDPEGAWVFPGCHADKHFMEPKKAIRKVRAASGVEFILHDLRRTFITIAESLDIPAYALKALLNHKNQSDITAGYIVLDVERLRKPMQVINDFLVSAMDHPVQSLRDVDRTVKQRVRTHHGE